MLAASALAGLAMLAASDGCDPNQGDGERCDTTDDCADGLVCYPPVCCPPDRQSSSSPDCRTGTTTLTDSGIDAATDGADSGADAADVTPDTLTLPDGFGNVCQYNSDCPGALVCLPGGTCGFQCDGDRDCPSGEHCPSRTCAAGTTGGSDNCADAGTDSGTSTDTAPVGSDDTGSSDDTSDAAAE